MERSRSKIEIASDVVGRMHVESENPDLLGCPQNSLKAVE
jgi:hypothetical protein